MAKENISCAGLSFSNLSPTHVGWKGSVEGYWHGKGHKDKKKAIT